MFCLSRETFLYSFTYAAGQLVIGFLFGVALTMLSAHVIVWWRNR